YISIEGWMGTTALILGAVAALGALWAARWEEDPRHREGLHWEDIPQQAQARATTITGEVVLAATCFLLGSVAFMFIEGWIGMTAFLTGAAGALGGLYLAHRDANPKVD
ncbi:MAG: hypothetical protein R3185_05920, partial [Candidatus Thermoplasmatota archaeon]|nr:hypothetical protein [Candidatus Thermoplasmatota archaeon]